jgi:hypothetical protein
VTIHDEGLDVQSLRMTINRYYQDGSLNPYRYGEVVFHGELAPPVQARIIQAVRGTGIATTATFRAGKLVFGYLNRPGLPTTEGFASQTGLIAGDPAPAEAELAALEDNLLQAALDRVLRPQIPVPR